MHGVEGVRIQDGLDFLAAGGELVHAPPRFADQGVSTEKNEIAAGEPNQRSLRTDVDYAANAEGSANIPEVVRYLQNVIGHVCLRSQ